MSCRDPRGCPLRQARAKPSDKDPDQRAATTSSRQMVIAWPSYGFYAEEERHGEAGDPGGAVTAFEELLTDRLRVLGPDHTP